MTSQSDKPFVVESQGRDGNWVQQQSRDGRWHFNRKDADAFAKRLRIHQSERGKTRIVKRSDYLAAPRRIDEYEALCAQHGFCAANPAPNSCTNCRFIETCGYSHLDISEEKRRHGPCILGKKSSGEWFFQPRA
jgi:hypothetical protein